MSAIAVVCLVGAGLLVVLISIAIHQRTAPLAAPEGFVEDASVAPPNELLPQTWARPASPRPPNERPCGPTVGQIAVGVCVGLWLFTISAGFLAMGVVAVLQRRWQGH